MKEDEEMKESKEVMKKEGVEIKNVEEIEVEKIMKDILKKGRIVKVKRDIEKKSGKKKEKVKKRNGEKKREIEKRKDKLGIGGEDLSIDMEKIVKRILLKKVDEWIERVIIEVEEKMNDERIGIGEDERNEWKRDSIGKRGEEEKKEKLKNGLENEKENIKEDIIEIGKEMKRRKRIWIGEDKRLGDIEELSDLERGESIVIIIEKKKKLIIEKN